MKRLTGESVWSKGKSIFVAVASVYCFSPQDMVTIASLFDDVTYAHRIVWNAEWFGWGDLGSSAMSAWHLALTLFFAYVSIMATYAMCARPGLAKAKHHGCGGFGRSLATLVLITIMLIAVEFTHYDEDAIGVIGQ